MFKKCVSNYTCTYCKITFPNSISNGAIASHIKHCKYHSKVLTLKEPTIPSHLVDIYHGDISEMPTDSKVYEDGPDPYEMRILLQNALPGEQEAAFEEVVLQMERMDDIDNVISSVTYNFSYMEFQKKLASRDVLINPLNFRGSLNASQLQTMHSIFLFIRKYQLSNTAGMYLSMYLSILYMFKCMLI